MVETVQFPQTPKTNNDFACLCKATLESKNCEVFSDYGNSTPNNVGSRIVPHLIHMASTIAKARTMSDYCNIGICSFQELNPDEVNAELATLNQISLIKNLAAELNTHVDYANLSKTEAYSVINELAEKKVQGLKVSK